MKVFVYFNLHRKCFSIKALEGASKGRVIKHSNAVLLCCPEFRVSEAGRQRVLKEQRKNVHAGVVGILSEDSDTGYFIDMAQRQGERITYNPYRFSTFVRAADESPITVGGSIAAMVVDTTTKKASIHHI